MPRPRATTPTYTLTQRGGGIWYVQWWENGSARRASTRTTNENQARRFREELISELLVPVPPAAPTVGDVLDGYTESRTGKVHSDAILYSARALRRHLKHTPTDCISPQRIAAYIADRRKEGAGGASVKHRKIVRPLSDGTLRRELGVLRTALNWAVKAKWIPEAPDFELPPTQPARARWLTKSEATRLLAGATYLHVRTFIALALFTAGRASAILELTWDRVDEAAGTIQLSDGRVRGRKRRQTVPIADDLHPYLAEARAAATSAYVIERRGGKVSSVISGVRGAASRAGVAGATPHVFRHTAATWMLQGGVPIKMVADYLGDTVAMIEKHYGQHSPTWLRQGAAALTLKTRQVDEETSVNA